MAVLLPQISAHLHSHMAHGQPTPAGRTDHPPGGSLQPSCKRPKLSLQTTSLSTSQGSLTRCVGPAQSSQAAFTPTTVNTLTNQWDLSLRPSPISRTDSPRPATIRAQASQQPYSLSLPFGVKPILKNSPLPSRQASVSASPRDSRRKVFFPQPKHVAFKNNLEDYIETQQYVARHSDLLSSEEDSSGDEEPATAATLDETNNFIPGSNSSPPPRRKRKHRRDSGVVIDEAMLKEPHTESSTGIYKRRKSRRTSDIQGSASDKIDLPEDTTAEDRAANESQSISESPKESSGAAHNDERTNSSPKVKEQAWAEKSDWNLGSNDDCLKRLPKEES